MAKIDGLFKLMKQQGASDLHISSGAPPILRQHGEMEKLNYPPLTNDQAKSLLFEILNQEQRAQYESTHDLDFAYEIPGLARFRGNILETYRGIAGVFRIIPSKILSADELNLPPGIRKLCNLKKGLVLVTGPTGSGKSTTLAAMVDLINATRREHILTLEDPLEFIHENKMSLMNQRQIGQHTLSFAAALKGALREDPDVILVGEMRDLETISLAMTAAETGHLVYGTLHTNSAPKTIDRIIDAFPKDAQEQVRTMLGESLKGVICQQLMKTADGRGASPPMKSSSATRRWPTSSAKARPSRSPRSCRPPRGRGCSSWTSVSSNCSRSRRSPPRRPIAAPWKNAPLSSTCPRTATNLDAFYRIPRSHG